MSSSPCSPSGNQFINDVLLSPSRSPYLPSELRSPDLPSELRHQMPSVETPCPLSALTQPFTPTQLDQRSPSPTDALSCELSKEDWYAALQQEKIQLPPNKRATIAQPLKI